MNTTDNNLDSQPVAPQPTAITRRSFIKRTAATALVVTLALGAFQSEARAEESGGSHDYILETTGLGHNYMLLLDGPEGSPVEPRTEIPTTHQEEDQEHGGYKTVPDPQVAEGPWVKTGEAGLTTTQLRVVLKSGLRNFTEGVSGS